MNNKPKLRLPRLDEVKGKNELEVIRETGARAYPTDFAKMMGCAIYVGYSPDGEFGYYYLEEQDTDDEILKEIGSLTKTKFGTNILLNDLICKKENREVIAIGERQGSHIDDYEILITSRKNGYIGIRLVMPIEDGASEVGYLPKRKVEKKERSKLKRAERKGKLEETPYTYTIDDRIMKNREKNEMIQNKRTVYKYNGKLYVKLDNYLSTSIRGSVPETQRFTKEEFYEVEPVEWLDDLESKKRITKDIVWNCYSYDDIDMAIKILTKEMFQMRERDVIAIRQEYKPGFLDKVFHRSEKIKALPEGTHQVGQGNSNDEQEVGTETIKSEQTAINEFQEGIRKAATKTDIIYYVKGEDGDLYPTKDSNNSDYYMGEDGVLRPTKEPIENHYGDSERLNNPYVAKISADRLFKKPNHSGVELSNPPQDDNIDR